MAALLGWLPEYDLGQTALAFDIAKSYNIIRNIAGLFFQTGHVRNVRKRESGKGWYKFNSKT